MNASRFSTRARAAVALAVSIGGFGAWRAASTASNAQALPLERRDLLAQTSAVSQTPRYKLQKIVDVQFADGAVALNNRGQVLLGTEGSKIVLWQDGKVRMLPAVATSGASSRKRSSRRRASRGSGKVAIWDALDINDRGQIVGMASDGQACLYEKGTLRLLGALSKSRKWDSKAANPRASAKFLSRNSAQAINGSGDMVGNSYTPQPTERVFSGAKEEGATQSWVGRKSGVGSITALPGAKFGCFARDINDVGQVVGSFSKETGAEGFSINRAFVWDSSATNGTMRDLGQGFANAINNKGQVVGGSGDAVNDSDARALLWQNGERTELGDGEAMSINNTGQIVGRARTQDKWKSVAAMLWQDGQQMMLKDRLDKDYKVRLESARFINDRGQIVVLAYPGGNALAYYALLSPVGS